MTSSKPLYRSVIIVAACLLAAVLVFCFVIPGTSAAASQRTLQDSWQRLVQAGSYEFATTVEQVTYPAPALANVGESSVRETYQISGKADLTSQIYQVRLFQNPENLLNQDDGVEIHIERNSARGRVIGSEEWEELKDVSASSFFLGDTNSAFLAAARNIREVDSQTIALPDGGKVAVTRYSFDVDSDRYAAIMRDQMVAELQRAGELPLGMNLEVSEEYRQMVAGGEIWVDANGLPARMTVTMQMPPEKNGDRVEATITTEYFNHAAGQQMAAGVPGFFSGLAGLLPTGQKAAEMAMSAGIFTGAVLLASLMLVFSRRKWAYAAVAASVILSMVVTPLWQSVKAADFNAKQAEKAAAREETLAQASQQEVDLWNPHANPLDRVETGGYSPMQPAFKVSAQAAQPTAAADSGDVDTDQDGLTDAYESQFDITILNPNKADTDDDGLNDNVELKLNLAPGLKDTDGDGIWDIDEVRPFYAGDRDWYLNPGERDTDYDGIIDGIECPERANGSSNGVCRDTDGDGIPDAFDSDDDNDGVPTLYDESPYVVDYQVYTVDSPLRLSLQGAGQQPMLFTYQLIPANEKHLTYALNVLDWPSGDNDGQIQRVNGSTFADHMSSEQADTDPRSRYGDLRLIPMAEIRLSGDLVPLPLSRTVEVSVSEGSFSARFEFTSSEDFPGKTRIELTSGSIDSGRTLYLGQGMCDDVREVARLDLRSTGESTVVSVPLGPLAGGDYVLFVKDSSAKMGSCAPIPPVAHGKMSEYVYDSTTLQAYGGAARNDTNGDVLIYTPLSVVYDESGGKPVAFSTRVPFTNEFGGFDLSTQEVRLVWLLNMLTDVCKPMPDDYSESKSGTWCDKDKLDRWNTDISRVVHSYTDEFRLAGLSVVEEHGVDLAVIFENPQTDTDLQFDDPLWGLANGLENTFLAGRSSDGQNLDLTIAEIQRRFDPDHNGDITDPTLLWGFDRDTFRVYTYQYATADEVTSTIGDSVSEILTGQFNPTSAEVVTLLFARMIQQRTSSVGEDGASCSAAGCVIDLSGKGTVTQAMLNWAPYRRTGDQWTPYDVNAYLDRLEANLRTLPDYQPVDESQDARDYADGTVGLAKLLYQSLVTGTAMLVALNGAPVINVPAVKHDEDVFNEFNNNKGTGEIVATVINTSVELILDGLKNTPHLLSSIVFGETNMAWGFIKAFGHGAAQKASPITKLLTTTFRKVAFGVGVGIVIAAIATLAILYLVGGNSPMGIWAGRILFATFSAVSAVLAGVALVNAIKAIKSVAESSKAAAIIGVVVSAVITWGVFIYSWIASGATFGSVAFNNLLAEAIAATFTLLLMAALSATVVGAIIVAVIGLIDALINTICILAGANDLEEGHWVRQYVCIGISGWITKIIKWIIYSNTYLINYEDGNRLSFTYVDQDLEDVSAGMTYGNNMRIAIGVKNTIKKSSVPIDWKAAAYFWQYSDSNAKSAAFAYKLQTSKKDIHNGLDRGDSTSGWKWIADSTWEQVFRAETDGFSVPVPPVGLNQDPVLYLTEGSAIPVQECWAIFIPILMPAPLPICYVRTERASFSTDISGGLTVDVFPRTLDEFYTLVQDSSMPGGYRQAWTLSGKLPFPVLKDADGDGLLSKAYPGGNDPDDSQYDTDGDGLSDSFELSLGTNPRMADTDDDGLLDSEEVVLGTSPTRKDSDGDGLSDLDEILGWLYTYDFTETGAPLETMVYPDPLMADSDLDGVTDYLEKVYGFHPRVYQNSDVLEYELSMRELDAPLVMLRFNEEVGSLVFADSSNFGFSASCVAGECPLSGFDGRYGAAVRFDGGELLRITTSAKAITLGEDQPFSVGGWVNTTTGGTLFSKWNQSAGDGVRFEITSDLRLALISAHGTATSQSAVPAGTWAHVAAVFDGTRAQFFINGSPAGTASFSVPAPTGSPVEIILGAYEGSGGLTGFYAGGLDELAFFDFALPAADVVERWMMARYNFNDSYVRPGEELVYSSTVTNLLNSRFAYGLLTTVIDKVDAVVDWASKLLPRTFVLYPDNPVVQGVNSETMETRLQIEPDHAVTEDVTFTQTATAQIVDRRSESNLAELWLRFEEGPGAQKFVDDSGNMPPRDVTCTDCPYAGETGMLNRAVRFRGDYIQRIDLPDLGTMNMLDRGWTFAAWVKPDPGSYGTRIPLVDSAGNRFSIELVRQIFGGYLPAVYVNGSNVLPAMSWRTMKVNVWSHLVVKFEQATGRLTVYINGGEVFSVDAASIKGNPETDNLSLWLGGSMPAGFALDDLRIFSRPLSAIDVNRLAERPVLELTMDSDGFGDSSVYNQKVVNPKNWPARSSEAVRGTSLYPGEKSSLGYIYVDGNELLDMSDGSFTFSLWVYPLPQSNSTWQGIFGRRELNNEHYAYPTLERQGNRLRFGFGDGSQYVSYTSGDVLTERKWNQVTITFAPSPTETGKYIYRLYVDSDLKESAVFTSTPTSATSFYVGHSSKSYRVYLDTLYMDDEHDAGSHAEPYIEEYVNGSHVRNPMGEKSLGDGDSYHVNYARVYDNFETVRFEVWEADSTSGDDKCGTLTRTWYDFPDNGLQTLNLSNGFDGRLTYQMTRTSIQFFGYIDNLEVYRYAIDSEQAYDIFHSEPLIARLPLDDRPSSNTFENRAEIGVADDGVCGGIACPAAGTTGLINQAVRFDGADDVISVPVRSTGSYMISLWLNTTTLESGVYSLYNGDNLYHQLYLKNGNICSLVSSTEMCSQGGRVADGSWHFVVYANNGSTADLWLDGEKVDSRTSSPAVPSPGTTAKLGFAPGVEHSMFNGQLDDVRLFRYAQDEATIRSLQSRAPIFMAHLDEPDGSQGFDDATPGDFQLDCSGACPSGGLPGRLQSAVEFNQPDAALRLRQERLSTDTTGFTVSVWVYPTQVRPSEQSILTIADGSNASPRAAINLAAGSTAINVYPADGSGVHTSFAELIQNTWNLITVVVEPDPARNGENFFLYINGYLDSSWTANGKRTGLGRVTLGSGAGMSGAPGGPYTGKLDEVAVYAYALNEIEIRDIFTYQMGQVEETASLTMTIDADDPFAELVSYNLDFPYSDENDRVLHVEASDATSGIAMVEMKVQHVDAPAVEWSLAPVCLDAPGGTAFCPTFDPKYGEGRYTLSFRAVDQVGNQVETGGYEILVDRTAPRIFANLQDGGLYAAEPHPTIPGTWVLPMRGTVLDDVLSQGMPGSGLDLSSVRVTVTSENGELAGMGQAVPTLTPASNGYEWSLDFLFPEREPTGVMKVTIEAKDRVGNLATRVITILLDASAPAAQLESHRVPEEKAAALTDESTLGEKLLTGGRVGGMVSDEPQEGIPYLTEAGKAAASGVERVQVAFEPSLNVSTLYNEPYPEDLLAWLPLDSITIPENAEGVPDETLPERYFMDISPFQFSGVCSGENCPEVGETGHRSGSIRFDGNDKYINLGSNVNLANRSFSVLVWAKRDQAGHSDPFLWQGPLTVAGQRFLFGIDYADRLVCGFGGSDLVTAEAFGDTEWHAYACTYDAETGRRVLYRDGQEVAADTAAPVAEMNEDLFVGSAPVGSLDGSLDELMVLGRVLTAEQVRELYTGYQTVFHLTVEDTFLAGGAQIIDRSGFFHRATLLAGDGDEFNKVTDGAVGDFALHFDGDDSLAVDPAFSLQLDRGAFTQMAWIRPDASAGPGGIISQFSENPELRYPSIYLTENDGLIAGFGSYYAWNQVESPAGVIQRGAWNFVAARYNGQTYSLYVNGQLVAKTSELAGFKPYPANQFQIGDGFIGDIDDVKIFTRALSDLELAALAQSGWRDAALAGSAWSSPVPEYLEGPYQANVRGWDNFGHFATGYDVSHQWGGIIDTLAPRFTFERVVDPQNPELVTYTFSVEDSNLDETSIRQNLCPEAAVKREYFNASWLLSTGVPPNTNLYRISGTCTVEARTYEPTGIYACDLAGNCVGKEYPAVMGERVYLPFAANGEPGAAAARPQSPARPAISAELAEKVSTWATLAETTSRADAGQAPVIDIWTGTLTPADVRSLFHSNLRGTVSDDTEVSEVRVEIWKDGELIYTTRASVYEGLWNAVWFYPPGGKPADGVYTLKATAVDAAGHETSVERELTVQLKP